ncbi:MAG: DUF2282 domain-containing protein [Rhodanobacter sp.]
MNNNKLIKSALACALTLGMATAASVAMAQAPMEMTPQMQKMQMDKTMAMMKKMKYATCYGVNAAFKNDCQSPGHSCAGQDATANDAQAFVAMPAGLCTKIAGGSLTKG